MVEMLQSIIEGVLSRTDILIAVGVFSAVAFVGTLAAVPVLLVRLPAYYFLHPRPHLNECTHPVRTLAFRILRNCAGTVLLAVGTAMLLLPGQGLLTLLIALTLLDFPGKRKMEVSILRRPGVHRAVDALRARYGREPIEIPAHDRHEKHEGERKCTKYRPSEYR